MEEQLINGQGLVPPLQDQLNPQLPTNHYSPPIESPQLPNNDQSPPILYPQLPNNHQSPPIQSPPIESPPIESSNYLPQQPYQYQQNINRLRSKEKSMHCQSLIATIILVLGVTIFCLLYFLTQGHRISFIAFIIVFYLLYLLVGCFCNQLVYYLKTIERGQNFQIYYDYLRQAKGFFRLTAIGFHYESVSHSRTVTDANGNSTTQNYSTLQQVITYSATEYLIPQQSIDQSGDVDQISDHTDIVLVDFFAFYKFYDQQSQNNYQIIFNNFKSRHIRDLFQAYSINFSIPGLTNTKSFYVRQLQCDYKTWFYIVSAFGFIWPYSLWVQSKISRFQIGTKKVLKI